MPRQNLKIVKRDCGVPFEVDSGSPRRWICPRAFPTLPARHLSYLVGLSDRFPPRIASNHGIGFHFGRDDIAIATIVALACGCKFCQLATT